jgi:hypothetical protein
MYRLKRDADKVNYVSSACRAANKHCLMCNKYASNPAIENVTNSSIETSVSAVSNKATALKAVVPSVLQEMPNIKDAIKAPNETDIMPPALKSDVSEQLTVVEIARNNSILEVQVDTVAETQRQQEEETEKEPLLSLALGEKNTADKIFIKTLPKMYHINDLINDLDEWDFMEVYEGYPPAYRSYVIENDGSKSDVEIVTAPVMQYILQSRVKLIWTLNECMEIMQLSDFIKLCSLK